MIGIRSLTKIFKSGGEAVRAVDGVDLQVDEKEFFVLLGLSGSGKTTLLRCVAGLEKADGGIIKLGDVVVSAPGRGIFIPAEDRALGMVFQSYAVWPHMTVFENVAFPLANGKRKLPRAKVRDRVMGALELVQLAALAARPVPFLSGGQQQRVALARALAVEPKVLLMDEPLSNLDARLREEVRDEIRNLATKLSITVLYVTHDQTEAMTLSDRIAVVHDGRFEQVGTPEEVYERPATAFVGEFLGRQVILDGTVRERDGKRRVELSDGALGLAMDAGLDSLLSDGAAVRLFTRPEDIRILPAGELSPHQLAALIEQVDYLGDRFEYHVRAAGALFVLPADKKERHAVGAQVRLCFDPNRLNVQPRR